MPIWHCQTSKLWRIRVFLFYHNSCLWIICKTMLDHQHKARNDLSCFPYADERPVDPRRAHFLLRGRHRGHAAPPRDRARVGGEGGRLRHRRRQRGGHLPPPPDPVGLGRGSRQFRSLGDHQVIYIINRITESEVATKTENFFRALDREKRAQYILTVAADLPDTASTATFRVFVAVLDINDNPPVFDQVRRARSQHDP